MQASQPLKDTLARAWKRRFDAHAPRCRCALADLRRPPRRSTFKIRLRAVSRRAIGFRRGDEVRCDEHGESTGRPAHRVSALAGQIGRPVVHEPTPALEQVCTPIGRLDPVLDDMRESRLDDLAGMIRFPRPTSPGNWSETRGARPRSRASRASGAVASPRAACRPDWETGTD